VSRLRIALGTLVAVAALVWLVRELAHTSRLDRPSVLVIAIDTLRADRLGCYGYARPTSPNIDALATKAVVFEHAISQAPWTLPAFASIVTGVLPSTHGAGRGKGWKAAHLRPGRPTLATVLRGEGYRTASFVSNGWVSSEAGMAEGIDEHDRVVWIGSQGATTSALRWLRENAGLQFYMFLHLIDPHGPYEPAAKHLAALGLQPSSEDQERVNAIAGGKHSLADLLPGDPALLSDLYDGEVRQTDERVGEVVAALRALGLLEHTIVIIVSDHGEELLEHGRLGHGNTLYDEMLHVPLIIRAPGAGWVGRVREQVRTMDVFPTVLDLLKLPLPAGLDSRSLIPLMKGEREAGGDRSAASEFLWQGHEQKSLRRPDAKMVLTPGTGDRYWYDLKQDPAETRRVLGGEVGAALEAELERVFDTRLDGLLVSVFGDQEEHDLRLVLETETRFDEVEVEGGEASERITLSPDRRRVKVRFHLDGSSYPPGWVDVDGLRVRTADDAPVRMSGTMDGRIIAASTLRLGSKRRTPGVVQPWTFSLDDPLIAVPAGYRPTRDKRASISVMTRGTLKAEQQRMSPETERRLRAIGYVD